MPLDITATLGVPGSASTWAFNVVRELQRLHHDGKDTESFYSDAAERAAQVFRDQRHLDRRVIWKLHEPDDTWPAFLAEHRIKLVLSIRDPRDAMLSLMERFGETKDIAFERVNTAFNRIIESLDQPHVTLRYEDMFFEHVETVAMLAQYLDVALDQVDRGRIFTTYRTTSVRTFSQTIGNLPIGRVRKIGDTQYDEVTQIHETHIGNQRVGKWRDEFTAGERRSLNSQFRLLLDVFGYDLD